MVDRICSLCGTHYTDKKGHRNSDCWDTLRLDLLHARRVVKDLQYNLEQVQERINKEALNG